MGIFQVFLTSHLHSLKLPCFVQFGKNSTAYSNRSNLLPSIEQDAVPSIADD